MTTHSRPSQSAKPRGKREAALVVFAKAPLAGQVKTRLCPPLTEDEAATLHGTFVIDTLERVRAAEKRFTLPIDRYLACAPDSTLVFFKIMEERQQVALLDQVGEDLGARMHHVMDTLFARGYQRVVLVGTDVPTLPLEHFQSAFAALEQQDLVLGPSQDGGYFLIGLRTSAPGLFAQIPWSTDRVLALTQQKAENLGLRQTLLPAWRDTDTVEDLQALIADCVADVKRPKAQQVFSMRTAGTLQLLAKRLHSRG